MTLTFQGHDVGKSCFEAYAANNKQNIAKFYHMIAWVRDFAEVIKYVEQFVHEPMHYAGYNVIKICL